MSNIKIDVSELSKSIADELENYSQEVVDGIKKECSEAAKVCLEEIREASPVNTGDYKKGWRMKKAFEDNASIRIIVYNKKHYRLTHLLEKGHLIVSHGKPTGKRTAPHPHIRPAEQRAEQRLGKKVKIIVRGGGT